MRKRRGKLVDLEAEGPAEACAVNEGSRRAVSSRYEGQTEHEGNAARAASRDDFVFSLGPTTSPCRPASWSPLRVVVSAHAVGFSR